MGNQQPRLRIYPEGGAYTEGPDAAELCKEYWFDPDPWQRMLLDDWLTRDEYGRLLCVTAGLSCPRQNGKNGAIEALEFYLMLTDGNTHILHTAHQVKTARKAFERLSRAFAMNPDPEIRAMVDHIRNTNGQEGIFLTNGASIEYVARSRGSARGFDNITLVIWDEAQELQQPHVDALMYTLGASKGDRMMIYTGTPPSPDVTADVFRLRRKRFIERPSARSCYHEWGITDLPRRDVTFEDLIDAVYDTNPAMGTRLDEDFTREEFDNATLEGFCRERLGWWQEFGIAANVVSRSTWDKRATPAPPDSGKVCFAVKFSADGSTGALCAAIRPENGPVHVELVTQMSMEEGTRCFADWLLDAIDVASFVIIDGKSDAEPLRQRLLQGRPDKDDPDERERYSKKAVAVARTADLVEACSMFVDAVREGDITHFAQPLLTDSVTKSTKRLIGKEGGYGFGAGSEGVAPEPAEAAALAYRACMTTRRDASRKGDVG